MGSWKLCITSTLTLQGLQRNYSRGIIEPRSSRPSVPHPPSTSCTWPPLPQFSLLPKTGLARLPKPLSCLLLESLHFATSVCSLFPEASPVCPQRLPPPGPFLTCLAGPFAHGAHLSLFKLFFILPWSSSLTFPMSCWHASGPSRHGLKDLSLPHPRFLAHLPCRCSSWGIQGWVWWGVCRTLTGGREAKPVSWVTSPRDRPSQLYPSLTPPSGLCCPSLVFRRLFSP